MRVVRVYWTNVIIDACFEVRIISKVGVGPIIEIGWTGKTDDRFDVKSRIVIPPGDGTRRIQPAPKGETPTGGAANQIDAAIALRVGERGQNLAFGVVGLSGRLAVSVLTGQCPRRRKTVINLKDEEAGILKVMGRRALARDAVVAVLQVKRHLADRHG